MGTSQPRSSIERGADGIMVRAMLVALASLLSSSAAFSAAPLVPSTGTGARAVVNMMAMGSLEISKPGRKDLWAAMPIGCQDGKRLLRNACRRALAVCLRRRGTVSAGPDGEPLPVSSTLVGCRAARWSPSDPDPGSGDFQVNSPSVGLRSDRGAQPASCRCADAVRRRGARWPLVGDRRI